MTARTTPKWGSIALFAVAVTAFGILCAGDPARAAEPTTITVEWLTTNTSLPDKFTAEFPQNLLAEGDCGFVQTDTYRYSTPEDVAAVDAILADGRLDEREDWGVILPGDTGFTFREIPCESSRVSAAVGQSASKAGGTLAATGFDTPWLFVGALALIVGGILLIRAPFRAVQKKRESK